MRTVEFQGSDLETVRVTTRGVTPPIHDILLPMSEIHEIYTCKVGNSSYVVIHTKLDRVWAVMRGPTFRELKEAFFNFHNPS